MCCSKLRLSSEITGRLSTIVGDLVTTSVDAARKAIPAANHKKSAV
jgi:hypothetical protein